MEHYLRYDVGLFSIFVRIFGRVGDVLLMFSLGIAHALFHLGIAILSVGFMG